MFDFFNFSGMTLFMLLSPFILIVIMMAILIGQLSHHLRQQKTIIQQQQELIRLTIKSMNRRDNDDRR
ncbi:hypothetical protein ERX37_09815 [Macrococcus hajekii]|uniref:Uncharacterized protein n=1 Tax=Macrococcus hajekii TaxID=198482 RepID=A0A4R6BHU6_9STAP|nr:hypothetical protein [Macrococcus hajekii]TDM01168.1 hypothetical protein ERX37_09815 [Macrococcus hajekii]